MSHLKKSLGGHLIRGSSGHLTRAIVLPDYVTMTIGGAPACVDILNGAHVLAPWDTCLWQDLRYYTCEDGSLVEAPAGLFPYSRRLTVGALFPSAGWVAAASVQLSFAYVVTSTWFRADQSLGLPWGTYDLLNDGYVPFTPAAAAFLGPAITACGCSADPLGEMEANMTLEISDS